jgi:dynein heavy chain
MIPPSTNMEEFLLAIDEIPLFTSPGVFGLHSNAEISYFTNSAKDLWFNTLKMQTSDGGSSGAVNKEEYIEKVAQDIYDKLPEVFDIYNIKKNKDYETPQPTQIVLLQELERFNILLETLATSLFDLQRALVGEIGMSATLDELANCIFNGFVPPSWKLKAPQSQKSLVTWMDHFNRRYSQYKDWIEIEEPKVIWLSGLHIPESYLTALLQTTCRARVWPLDKSLLYTVVTKETNPANIKKRLEAGTYIQGIYLEGARWNMEKDCLDYQLPKQLIMEMPLIRIVPIEANKLKLRGTIKTPVYVTQARKDVMHKG